MALEKYTDPGYNAIDLGVEEKLGLPTGLLTAIRTRGERSNADQVSSAKAKTVYQVIPETRDAIIAKYKIDPWLSPENAALGAGYLLKEGLERNRGDVSQSVGEYVGGIDRKNWGPVTKSYINRVMTGFKQSESQAIAPQQGGRRLTQELNAQPAQPSIAKIFQAYQSGEMPEDVAGEFEADVRAGKVLLPRGAELKASTTPAPEPVTAVAGAPSAPPVTVNAAVMKAYQDGTMPEDVRAELAADLQSGRAVQEPGLASQIGRQLGLTARYGIEGVAGTVGMLTDPIGGVMNLMLPEGAKAPTAGAMGTRLANVIGLPQPQGELEQVVGAAARGVAGAAPLLGAGQALANLPGAVGKVGQFLAANPAAQAAAGAGAGGSSEFVAQEGGGQAAQVGAALAGGLAAPALMSGALGAASLARRAVQPAAPNQLVQEAAQLNVPLMTTDVIPPKSFIGRTAQATGERIPFAGTAGKRIAQQESRVNAVKQVASEVGGDLTKLQDEIISGSLLAKRSGDIKKYSGLKNEVFDRLDQAGAVPANNTVKKIDDEIARLTALDTKEVQPLVNSLDDFKTAIQGKSIKQVEDLRKMLGTKLGSDEFTAVKDAADKVNRSLYGAVNKDIESFIKTVGEPRDATKWKIANQRLSGMFDELESNAFKRALDKGSVTPETVRSLLFSQKPSDVQRLYRSLTPAGRDAARTAIVQDALTKAGGMENISPQKFINALEKNSAQTGVFFKPEQKQQADGLVRVIKATQRASETAAAPPTGVQAVPFAGGAILADLFGSFGAALAGAGSIGGVARAYESAPIRNLLLKVAKTKPASKEEFEVLRRMIPAIREAQQGENEKKSPIKGQGSQL